MMAPSITISLPQSVVLQISIFWNGDCTSSTLPVTRNPIADPECSKFS